MAPQRRALIEGFGWVASLMILSAYAMTSMKVIDPSAPMIHGLNLFGSLGVGAVTYVRRAYQALMLNAVWALIALVGFVRYFSGG